MKIKVDTVTITDASNGVSVPFHSGYNTSRLVEASVSARGSMAAKMKFDRMMEECDDVEMRAVFNSYKKERARWIWISN